MTSINITDKQTELLKAVVEVMKADIDWDKVAELANMKTGKYARDQWAVLRKKMIGSTATKAGDKADDSDVTAAPKPTATPGKRKAAAETDGGETPTKKKAGTRKPKKTTPAGDEEAKVKEEPEEPNEAGEAMDEMS
ncbi:hypothetical protein LTR37_007504 [Vermiconidia calcicola]|uniref:Uncharacterized protein n=1 Tax=Vermiconidia calcicola TaxID=1690605 RepID=A0ACC3NDJ1_9PEZI|nr:hypothetical protein LTR37_007504 [Vermiconidia calcicola]